MFNPNEIPEWLDESDWTDFQAHRKEIGKPMTDTAKRRMLMKLYRMHEAGENISQVIERSIVNGWQDVWPLPPEQKQPKPQSHQDYKPERVVSDEKAAENVVKLHQALESAAVPKSMPKGQRFDANGKPIKSNE